MEWLIILGAVLAALILGVVYLTACIGRFSFVRRISGETDGGEERFPSGYLPAYLQCWQFPFPW